jgi:hypothetical protein
MLNHYSVASLGWTPWAPDRVLWDPQSRMTKAHLRRIIGDLQNRLVHLAKQRSPGPRRYHCLQRPPQTRPRTNQNRAPSDESAMDASDVTVGRRDA